MEQNQILSRGNLQIFCTHTEPDYGEIRRVVLGIHGLGGSTQDAIQTGIAEEMEMFRSATVRFDLPGHGQSPMDENSFTFDNCIQSLLTVVNFIQEQYPDVADLCIFASGFGAYLALCAMDELVDLPYNIRLVIQTPPVMMHSTLLAMKGITAPTLEAMGKVSFGRSIRPFCVDYQFYQDLMFHPIANAYPIPMLILMGEEDSYIKMEDVRLLRNLNERAKLVIIPGTSHRFLEEGAWDMVLDLTRDWFEYEQVLCCDWE